MKPTIEEKSVRSVLSKSGIPGMTYCVNPYVGCLHACLYCYATFMKRFTGHTEPWGSFADVKINAPEVLRRELRRAKRGGIIMSSVTDPYQPVEKQYQITRKCLEVIELFEFPLNILTKSPLVTRDIDIIKRLKDVEVGLTITTDNDKVRRIFEPQAPSIASRIKALRTLHEAGIETYVFIGPLLPMDPAVLADQISPFVKRVLIDRMNYINKTEWLYKKYGMERWLDEGFTEEVIEKLYKGFQGTEVEAC